MYITTLTKITSNTVIILPNPLVIIFINCVVPFGSYLSNKSDIKLFIEYTPNSTSIDNCLLDISVSKISPPNMKKSFNLIFVSVNINIDNAITITAIVALDSISTIGKCSFMLFVVFPFIVFTRYVYGVSPSGVNSPVNIHIIIISINHLTLSFLCIFILYGFCLLSNCRFLNSSNFSCLSLAFCSNFLTFSIFPFLDNMFIIIFLILQSTLYTK